MRWITSFLFGSLLSLQAFSPQNEFYCGVFDPSEYVIPIETLAQFSKGTGDEKGWIFGYQRSANSGMGGISAYFGSNILHWQDLEKEMYVGAVYASFRVWFGSLLFLHPYVEASVKGPCLIYSEEKPQWGVFQDYMSLGCAIGSWQAINLSIRVYRYYEDKENALFTTPYVFCASLCF